MPRRLILASASPRRRELLALLGLPFEAMPSEVDESLSLNLSARGQAEHLAVDKGEAVCWKIMQGAIVIGADTVVAAELGGDEIVLGKPTDPDDARRMLRLLSGATHTVFTGISVFQTAESKEPTLFRSTSEVADTQVQFRKLTDDMIDAYIATGDPMDKAGAYGIQSGAAPFVEAIYGDYFNVVGLPVATVARMLEDIGIEWWRGAASLE